jgi:hypothetical protein
MLSGPQRRATRLHDALSECRGSALNVAERNNWCSVVHFCAKIKIVSFFYIFIRFWSNSRSSKILTLVTGMYELLPAVRTSIVQFGWSSAQQVGMSLCCDFVSFLYIGAGKALPVLHEISFPPVPWHWMIIWYSLCSALWAHHAVCGALSLILYINISWTRSEVRRAFVMILFFRDVTLCALVTRSQGVFIFTSYGILLNPLHSDRLTQTECVTIRTRANCLHWR